MSDDSLHGPHATYRSSSCDTRFGAPLDDTDSEVLELREEVARLRAALVRERAEDCLRRLYLNGEATYDLWDYGATEEDKAKAFAQARGELAHGGLLPPT
jgi:hypothetical protein